MPFSFMAERRLMMFFGLAYFAHGIACGLANQPFTNYFKSLGNVGRVRPVLRSQR